MKLGILTFHSQLNYGGVLQCWAIFGIMLSMCKNFIEVL